MNYSDPSMPYKRAKDRLSWTTLADDATLARLQALKMTPKTMDG